MESKTDQLDIRRIISNSIGLTDFFRCFLNQPQKALLAKQRSRIAAIDSDDDENIHFSDEDLFEKIGSKEFNQALS